MDRILDFTARFSTGDGKTPSLIRFALSVAKHSGATVADPAMPAAAIVLAYVNALDLGGSLGWQGRWLTRCGDDTCGGAEYVDAREPVFMCCSCFNRMLGGQWARVEFPVDREKIEEVLLQRPGRNRNWVPGETVEDLIEENSAGGVAEVQS